MGKKAEVERSEKQERVKTEGVLPDVCYQDFKGVKGVSLFYLLPYWDINCFNIDLMHVIEGVMKQMFNIMKGNRDLKNRLNENSTNAEIAAQDCYDGRVNGWELPAAMILELEKLLMGKVKAPTGLVPRGLKPFTWTGNT